MLSWDVVYGWYRRGTASEVPRDKRDEQERGSRIESVSTVLQVKVEPSGTADSTQNLNFLFL